MNTKQKTTHINNLTPPRRTRLAFSDILTFFDYCFAGVEIIFWGQIGGRMREGERVEDVDCAAHVFFFQGEWMVGRRLVDG